jgi:hypothetical protein
MVVNSICSNGGTMKTLTIVSFLLTCITQSHAQPLCDFRGRDSLMVILSGDTVNIWDMAACTYCGEVFVTSVSLSADSIYIVQTDTSNRMATCDCIYNMRTSVVGLPSGTYWAVIYRSYPPSHSTRFIRSIRFQYISTTSGIFSSKVSQSGCIPDAVSERFFEFPNQYALLENYPNPFNPRTTLRYQTVTTEFVSIKVYDLLGREIQTLVGETKAPGFYVATFDAPSQASSGIYFCRMVAGNFVQTRTMTLLR